MTAYQLCIIAAGVFFLTALLTGVWKYLQIRASENAQAHHYVDIAHRAALMYSFAAILFAVFVEISQLSATVEFWAAFFPLLYFGLAIVTYIVAGAAGKTDNQLRDPAPGTALFMWTLIAAEIGGFLVLFFGVLVTIF